MLLLTLPFTITGGATIFVACQCLPLLVYLHDVKAWIAPRAVIVFITIHSVVKANEAPQRDGAKTNPKTVAT